MEKQKTSSRQARRLKKIDKYRLLKIYSTASTTGVVDQNRAIIVEIYGVLLLYHHYRGFRPFFYF